MKLKCYHVTSLIGFYLIFLDFKYKLSETETKTLSGKNANEPAFYSGVVFS